MITVALATLGCKVNQYESAGMDGGHGQDTGRSREWANRRREHPGSPPDLIAEAVLAIRYRLTARQLAETIHAHPTLPEAMAEAAEAVDRLSIHY